MASITKKKILIKKPKGSNRKSLKISISDSNVSKDFDDSPEIFDDSEFQEPSVTQRSNPRESKSSKLNEKKSDPKPSIVDESDSKRESPRVDDSESYQESLGSSFRESASFQESENKTISDIEEFTMDKNYKIIQLYSSNGYYKYIEILSKLDGEKLFIYIQSKYKIPLSSQYPSFEIKDIDDPSDKSLIEDIEEETGKILSSKYSKDDVDYNDNEMGKLGKKWDNQRNLIYFSRQLKRLRLCLGKEGKSYKLLIKHGIGRSKYFSLINRKDEIEHFHFIDKNSTHPIKEFTIMTDLEEFYRNVDDISLHLKIISKSIYNTLKKVHLASFTEIKTKMEKYISKSEEEIKKYKDISQYLNILNLISEKIEKFIKKEEDIYLELQAERDRYSTNEVRRAHRIGSIEKKLESVKIKKEELIKLKINAKITYDLGMLDIDNILFENTLLMDRILENTIE